MKRSKEIFESHDVTSGKIPIIQYTKNEQETWDLVFQKYTSTIENNAAQEVQEAFRILQENNILRRLIKPKKEMEISQKQGKIVGNKQVLLYPQQIMMPQMAEVSLFLHRHNGWQLKPVPGLISNRDYLLGLANKVYCSTQTIRREQDYDFSPYPDYIHDFLGHILPIASPRISQILHEIGQLSIGASDEQIELITDAYWKVFEMGFIKQKSELRALGGAVLSSSIELQNALQQNEKINKLELLNYKQKSNIEDESLQNQYHYISEYEEIIEKLKQKLSEFKTQSQQKYRNISKLQELNNNSPQLSFWDQKPQKTFIDTNEISQYHQDLQKEFDDQTQQQFSFPIRHHNFEKMSPYLRHYLNNHGDPYQSGVDYNGMRTRQIEKQVINYFAEFYRLPSENKDKHWGYMASGSTESNMQALYFAREYFRKKDNVAVFYSNKAHTGISKSIYYLKMDSFGQVARKLNLQMPDLQGNKTMENEQLEWPDLLPAKSDGSLDTEKLKTILKPFADRKIPAIFVMTAGTTAECAFDNVTEAIKVITSFKFYKNGNNFWLHVDGAWCAPYARLLQIASNNKANQLPRKTINQTNFDFSIPFVRSITTSIHKWIPSPFPASVLVVRDQEDLPRDNLKEIYIKGIDLTLTTSRNGHIPIFTWDYLIRNDVNSQVQEAVDTYQQVNSIYEQLKQLEQELGYNLMLFHNEPLGLNIRLKKPSDKLCYKYGLMVPGSGDQAVLFVMPDKSHQLAQQFIQDYKQDMISIRNKEDKQIQDLQQQIQTQ
eukprot:403342664